MTNVDYHFFVQSAEQTQRCESLSEIIGVIKDLILVRED